MVAPLISGGPALLGVEQWLPTARAHPLTTGVMAAAVGLFPIAATDTAAAAPLSGRRRGEDPATS